ncbi:amidase [Cocleimonas flava]|uniref:Aspartyl-tRNA(Asn)/glutamyl-tRNA(Gln) amidotransferase subunit A n=1 Tax=Cocleimonas flava TaxID=634765 RepID=A0A4R1F6U4_9GAMM|nr:amidase family protein [Cocleimonas flava]TCJ88294.1 aspartyl-tRNA(Asn)/glutamyl-tRNA(Gln) amidotransferase subunit A [Cocleimonas flava]
MIYKSWSFKDATTRLDTAITRIENNPPELRHVFTQTFIESARNDLNKLECFRDETLCGAIISIKDLLDVEGFVTRSGSTVLSNNPPAKKDADVVDALRNSGAILIGHTNMSEFAYSGLGLNPHYGTPENTLYKDHIPGGSTSGGAVSVATNLCDIAIGTDTGGSLRIPAAFNGIVGFKPSQQSVSLKGCNPLSFSLDSIGPMASSVEACEAAWSVMSGFERKPNFATQDRKLIIPKNFGLTELDEIVAEGFQDITHRLIKSGIEITEKFLPSLEQHKELNAWHLSSVEANTAYKYYIQNDSNNFDPRVIKRIQQSNELKAVEYCETLISRQKNIELFEEELAGSLLLLPTVAILPPSFSEVENDDDYHRLNILSLRNTSLGNVMNGCSISIPFKYKGQTLGLMLTGINGEDIHLLEKAKQLASFL